MVLLTSGVLRTADDLVGTPKNLANTVISTATARDVERNLADSILTNIAKNSTPGVRALIDKQRAHMKAAIIRAMNEKANQALVRQYLERFYNVFTSDKGGSINIRPVILRFTSVVHRVDPSVPTLPSKLKKSVVHVKAVKGARELARTLGPAAWLGTLLGLLGAVIAARFLVRRRKLRPWAVGVTIGLPALLLFVVADVTRSRADTFHLGTSTARILVRQMIYRVDNGLTSSAIFLLVTDLLIVAVWLVLARLSRRRAAPTRLEAPAL